MTEVIYHAMGFCGEHWHPNIWTVIGSTPVIGTTIYYIKCKCGGWFQKHKSNCKNK